ncbi:hypothetical protein [Paraburkholderia caledonica]|uniref:Uncharacterized short protein YbdD (DUF466 family) n=1 Tax=Paraburkholderia caledonica TaxID=134536 RepID=A0AB73IRS8_9BURK|nr:uncharacterized short protein YbdD (DUF466 family) [Paraburkholderia caledonica]
MLQQVTSVVSPSLHAQAYNKSRELLDLVYLQGFSMAKTAFDYDMFVTDLRNEFPDAVQAEGRIAGTDEKVYWMSGGLIVAIWNPEMAVGVTGYTNLVRSTTTTH